MRRFKYEEGVDYYLKSIYKIPLLSEKEERELLERVKLKDKQALSRLIQANLRFVVNIAKRYAGYSISFQDLISAGNLGLIEAAKRYDPSKGVKFISYAVWWIKQSIHQLLNNQGEIIRKPEKFQNISSKIENVYLKLKEDLGKQPDIEQIVEGLRGEGFEIDKQTVELYISTKKSFMSIEEPIYTEDEELHLEDILSNSGTEEIEDTILKQEIESLITQLLDTLTDREKTILIHRFGLFDQEPKTLSEVGQLVGISRERVRQIENRLLKKLRKIATKKNLRDLIS